MSDPSDPTPPPVFIGGIPVPARILFAVVILVLIAGGVGAIKTYLDQSAAGKQIEEHGVETDADVVSVRGIEEAQTVLTVSYDAPGPELLEFAEVKDCSSRRYEQGIDVVRIVYVPDDPDTVRLAACRSSFDSDVFPGLVGIGLLASALFVVWRVRHMFSRS